MVSKSVGLALLLMMPAGNEPSTLVARLGADKYADRESAAAALEKLGPTAFPYLKAARNDPDPEIKNRAEVVLDSIERSLLTHPARLQLDRRSYTASELAELLASLEGIPLGVVEGNEIVPPARRSIEILKPAELGFWEVADRLGMTIQWDTENINNDFGRPMMFTRSVATVKLVPKSLQSWPTSDSGPFRVVMGTSPHFAVENSAFEPQAARARRMTMFNSGGGAGTESLVIPLEVWAEPRLALKTSANIHVIEAIDENDESVALNLKGEIDPANSAYGDRSVSTVRTRLRLKGVSPVPLKLKSLKGTIPVEVEARRSEPILIPIPMPGQDAQKPVVCGTTTVQIHGITNDPLGGFRGAGSGVDMTIHRDGWSFMGLGGRRGMGMVGQVLNNDNDRFWDSIEVVDADGRAYRGGTRRALSGEGDAIHLLYTIDPRDGVGPPTHLRYYGGIRTLVEIPFEFHDIKLR